MAAGTVFAISYNSNLSQVTPESLVVFTVLKKCVTPTSPLSWWISVADEVFAHLALLGRGSLLTRCPICLPAQNQVVVLVPWVYLQRPLDLVYWFLFVPVGLGTFCLDLASTCICWQSNLGSERVRWTQHVYVSIPLPSCRKNWGCSCVPRCASCMVWRRHKQVRFRAKTGARARSLTTLVTNIWLTRHISTVRWSSITNSRETMFTFQAMI